MRGAVEQPDDRPAPPPRAHVRPPVERGAGPAAYGRGALL